MLNVMVGVAGFKQTSEWGMPTIGARIRRARKRLGKSQGDIAQELGVTRGTVSEWERDRALPRQSMVEAIATTLDMPRASLNPFATARACRKSRRACF